MEITAILCLTFLVVLVVYWLMPVKKMRAVNKELIKLLRIFPVTRIIQAILPEKEEMMGIRLFC